MTLALCPFKRAQRNKNIKRPELIRETFKLLIRLYRALISPLLPPSCRFYPSCSEYALDALNSNGFFKALYLIVRRIGRCHPLNIGGYDPAPGSAKVTERDKVR